MAADILFVTNAITPDRIGGLERYVRELAEGLVAHGRSARILTKQVDPSHPRFERAASGVEIHRYGVPDKSDPLFAVRRGIGPVREVLREARGRPGVIHAQFPVPALPLALRGIPFVYTFQAPVWRELLRERQGSYALPERIQPAAVALLRRVEAFVVRRATQIIVLSEFMRGQLGDLDAAAGRRARLIPGGIDTHRFSLGPRVPDEWATGASPLLFTARRLTPRTGVRELVESLPRVVARHPGLRLAISGSGGEEGAIRAAIAREGLEEKVRLLGRVSDAELIDWYRRADLVVMPTQELEGFGLTTAEALACGTPVLGTPQGATPEILAPLDRRLVSRGPSPADLSAALLDVLGDTALLASVRDRARDHAVTYSWESVIAAHLDTYAAMAPPAGARRSLTSRGRIGARRGGPPAPH